MQAELSNDFYIFKVSRPAQVLFAKLGLQDHLKAAHSWPSLRELIVHFNGRDEGRFVTLARLCNDTCSSGERVLLHAVLYVTDFAWLADELAAGRAWRGMADVDGEWREAVAACVAAEV
jgi:hypothetical protein